MGRQNFGGFGGGANMQQLMRQAQKMQQQMQEAQERLDEAEYEATAGGGMVSVKVSGKRELTAITIDPQVVDPDDIVTGITFVETPETQEAQEPETPDMV